MLAYLNKINRVLTRSDKRAIVILLFCSILLSLIETVGISAIMPFISLASNPTLIERQGYYRSLYHLFAFKSSGDFLVVFGFLLIGFYVIRAFYNIFYTYLLNRFTFTRSHQFAERLFKIYIGMPYGEFINKNSSVLSGQVFNETVTLASLIQHSLFFLAEVFTTVFLYLLLLYVNLKMTLALTLILSVMILCLSRSTSAVLKRFGDRRHEYQKKIFKIIGEALSNHKLIKLLSNEKKIFGDFNNAFSNYTRANIAANTIIAFPRSVLETVGFGLLISVIMYAAYSHKDMKMIIPVITLFSLALYRILPSINRMISSFNNILFASKALEVVYDDFIYPMEKEQDEIIDFHGKIELNDISFAYKEDNKDVLNTVSLTLHKGNKLAFVGKSGSGKSTLVDLIAGIHKPQKGEILIDGKQLTNKNVRNWRRKIGYIPQSIYLFDDTVAENVVFGRNYDQVKIIEVLKKANIYDFLLEKDGIETNVGDGGIKLSVGQKQRIGIARALYDDPEILILDEATSALDNETEAKIMDEIYNIAGDKTLLVIAHRLSTIGNCDIVYSVQDNKIEKVNPKIVALST